MVLGFLSELIERTTQLSDIHSFCIEGNCYIRLENVGRSWSEAQQMCSQYNSTLPTVDNRDLKRSVEAVVHYFRMNAIDVWLGAKATDYGSSNWLWLDGRQYSGTGKLN